LTGGKTSFIIMPYAKTFLGLLENVEDTYLGKTPKKKWQKKYGKRYDKSEIKQIAYGIATKNKIRIDK